MGAGGLTSHDGTGVQRIDKLSTGLVMHVPNLVRKEKNSLPLLPHNLVLVNNGAITARHVDTWIKYS